MAKPAHYRGTYHVASARVRAAAYANPATRCRRCGHTLEEIRRTKPWARWQAGHVNDGEIGGHLQPECSPCNAAAGARLGNRRRAAARAVRTSLTW